MIKCFLVFFAFLLLAFNVKGQDQIPDTLLVRTVRNPITDQKHYVLKGTTEMIVYFGKEKNDTVYYSPLDSDILPDYERALRIYNLRLKPIKEIDADDVFDYFPLGTTPEEIIQMLGDKQVAISDNLLQVAFYNHWSKKNEIFSFLFKDGKLYGITRPSTNTLPTDDVWVAFQLLELQSNIQKLQQALERLSK